MPKQTMTLELEVPDGYVLDGYRAIENGELRLTEDGTVEEWNGGCSLFHYIIVRKVVRYRTPSFPADYGKQCEFSDFGDFSSVNPGKLYGYRPESDDSTSDYRWISQRQQYCFARIQE